MTNLRNADYTSGAIIYNHKSNGRKTILNKNTNRHDDFSSIMLNHLSSMIKHDTITPVFFESNKLRAIGAQGFTNFNEYLAYKRAKNKDFSYATINNEAILTADSSSDLPSKPNQLTNIFYSLASSKTPAAFDNEFVETIANTVTEQNKSLINTTTVIATINSYQDLERARKKYPGMFLDQGYELQADYGNVCEQCGRTINRQIGSTNFLCYECNKETFSKRPTGARNYILKNRDAIII